MRAGFWDSFLSGLAVGIFVTVCLSMFAIADNKHFWHVEAVESGHAEWIITQDGNVEFRWKEIEQ